MKYLALLTLAFLSLTLNAQTVYMKSGEFIPPTNVHQITDISSWNAHQYGGFTYCLIQFAESTSERQRKDIEAKTGIRFYEYFPVNAFLAGIPTSYPISGLSAYQVRSVLPFDAAYKIDPLLNERPFPTWMNLGNQQIEVLVTIMPNVTATAVDLLLAQYDLASNSKISSHDVLIRINENSIALLASYPWVKYIEVPAAPAVYENLKERTNHRVNTIDAAYTTGLHYDGTGVSVAVGDDGNIGPHIDFTGRLTNHGANNGGTHADHVSGIVGGGGNFDPITSGNARGSDLHIYDDYDNLTSAPTAYNTDGVRLTSNSLGQACNAGYNGNARDADNLINGSFSLMSVHSSGNSGGTSCGGVASGYYTITGGYKAGKNVIAVGNATNSDVIAGSSSRGPSKDGRIKPDVVAVGTDVYSTQPNNEYDTFTGTSMACPAVSGTLASLWQAYRETHAGADPYSALMKAVLMNTADDLGNPGPDFIYGFGRINARRAYNILSNNQFFIDSMDNGDGKDFFINIPPNTRQLKVMLYWNDYRGNPASSIALVNDLNLSMQEPSGNVIDPWVLNHTASVAALSANAIRSVDSRNNVEQITIDSVFAGPAIISVYGNNIPQGPQKYVITYEFIGDELTLTYPQGGEAFVPGVQERIRWDAFGNNAGDFTLEYSSDAGANWNTLSSTIPGNRRYYDWTPPASISTGQMMMRISRGAFSDISDSLFTVFEVPKNLVVDTACGTIFHLKWDAVPDADEYTVYSLGTKYMTPLATSLTNGITLTTGVNTTDTFYFAVSANNTVKGAKGLRTITVVKLPGEVNCLDDAFNVATILPFDQAYNCALTGLLPIKVKIKNQGFRALTNLPVFYQVNANPVISEVIPGPIPVGDSLIYTFTTLANFSAPISYNVTTWTSTFTDLAKFNDTSTSSAVVLIPTTVVAPSVQDFEGPLFPPTGWRVIDQDINVKWQKTLCLVDPNGFNTHTAYMDFFNYTNMNQVDELESLQFDLTGAISDSVLLTFDLSHAYGIKGIDSLSVLISEDCGANYVPTTYSKGGIPLATAGMLGTIYSPSLVGQWRNDQIDLTAYKGKRIFVRFKAFNMNGNNLFIDNINILLKDAWPLQTMGLGINEMVSVYPNPSDGNYTLEFVSADSKIISYSVFSVTGQKIKENRLPITSGKTRAALNISSLASGIYMLEVNDGTKTHKVKLLKH